jgi:hypothetical protein
MVEIPPPIGYGPWAIALFVHTGSTSCKRQTEIRIETYPELVPWAHGQCGQPGWVLVMMIGIFSSWEAAFLFYQQWIQPTRGKTRRIQRGLELLAKWCTTYHLCMWIQSKTLEETRTPPPPPAKKQPHTYLDDLQEEYETHNLSMSFIESIQHIRGTSHGKRMRLKC